MSDWYYNPETKQVEQGKVSGFDKRMGPYASKEEAERALDIVQQRNEAADAYDEQYEDED
ncbi:hypothetical protein NQ015_01935 [Corynebacterium sp. 153RC1]|uniref:hypothetical protein n=1 Tax=unclassified Corynebacterium TaxID=2624378 RepID=UPI00211D0D10|nr:MULTISPECIES: hypothetical protein [unclassified Corynebacterium]MCQ9369871.1 hypothetical protein [Corynebacterium sp. 35RC1]MCQ9352316.1 hypothetical protein [Corynebacterium sp. 209RC1]MCQ9354294.1 hypothetical protein [Corynebacterium sp. 1222RC1]MCQ9356576.1 hypothetical protein [Corynebacterium sp. 122RC1]MCQ9359586.1 hypothetical protein [Corynebacterium sp. 142RC1]